MIAEVLVDTSVWIDFLRRGDGAASRLCGRLLSNRAALISDLIATELLRGARGRRELRALDDLFSVVDWLDTGRDTCLAAGRLGREMAGLGLTIPTVDLVIAQTAVNNRVSILSLDRHFPLVAEHSALEIVRLQS
ncbi:MAG: PIN domain-containing protein [Polyangia bacterium]